MNGKQSSDPVVDHSLRLHLRLAERKFLSSPKFDFPKSNSNSKARCVPWLVWEGFGFLSSHRKVRRSEAAVPFRPFELAAFRPADYGLAGGGLGARTTGGGVAAGAAIVAGTRGT